MKRFLICLFVLFCGLTVSKADIGPSEATIVYRWTNQTAGFGWTTVLTPIATGLYKVTLYSVPSAGDVNCEVLVDVQDSLANTSSFDSSGGLTQGVVEFGAGNPTTIKAYNCGVGTINYLIYLKIEKVD